MRVPAASEPGLEMSPTVLMMGIEEELLVPFGAEDGAVHDVRFKPEFAHSLHHPLAGRLVEGRIADNSALSDLSFPDFELRLDQYNRLPAGPEQRNRGRQDQRDGDKADIAADEVDLLADVFEFQLAGVDAFVENDAGVGAERPHQLAGADVDGVNARGAGLQQSVGEAAGGGSDVERGLAGYIQRPVPKRAGEFEAAAADIRRPGEDFDLRIIVDRVARLGGLLPIHQNFTGHDEGLRFLA